MKEKVLSVEKELLSRVDAPSELPGLFADQLRGEGGGGRGGKGGGGGERRRKRMKRR